MLIDWLATGAALLAGLLGGVHCAAMCGGIAAGFSAMSPSGGWRAALEPNLGRVLGYAAAGAIAGGIGHGIVGIFRIEALAATMRAMAGLVLIVVAVRLFTGARGFAVLDRGNRALWSRLQPLQRALLPANTPARRMALGALWGWLPCGLSTSVLVAAWLQADALRGTRERLLQAGLAALGVPQSMRPVLLDALRAPIAAFACNARGQRMIGSVDGHALALDPQLPALLEQALATRAPIAVDLPAD